MVVVPTLVVIFGMISFAMTISSYSFLSNAARDAVRYAIVHGSKSTSPATSDVIQTFVRNKAQGLSPTSITVSSCWNPQAPPNQCPGPTGNNAPGKPVSVTVSYSIHPLDPFAEVTLPLSTSPQILITSHLTPSPSFRPPHRHNILSA